MECFGPHASQTSTNDRPSPPSVRKRLGCDADAGDRRPAVGLVESHLPFFQRNHVRDTTPVMNHWRHAQEMRGVEVLPTPVKVG